MDFANTALVHDELLFTISRVLDGGAEVGPAFVYALGSFVEATVVHSKVFYDPLRYTLRKDLTGGDLSSLIRQSPFVQQMVDAGALTLFPSREEVDTHIAGIGSDYRMIDFLVAATWHGVTFAGAEESEPGYAATADLLVKVPEVFEIDSSRSMEGLPGPVEIGPATRTALQRLGFTGGDVQKIEGWARRARAYVDLVRVVGSSLYADLPGLPYTVPAIRTANNKALELYRRIRQDVETGDDEPLGPTAFSRVPVPPFCQVVLANANGSPTARNRDTRTSPQTPRLSGVPDGIRACVERRKDAHRAASTPNGVR